jgi:hypothetical protein
MQATTARGTDAERTEEAAPVVVANVEVDAAGRLALDAKDVGLEVGEVPVGMLVLFPAETLPEALVVGITDVTGGRDGIDTVSDPVMTDGNVSVFPGSLRTRSSENH